MGPMREIKFAIDRKLLEELDRIAGLKRTCRSALVRAAVQEYLAGAAAADISKRYKEGYSSTNGWTAKELEWLED